MRLDDLIDESWVQIPARYRALDIRHVTADSRRVEPGSLFIAVSGETTDGLRYASDAVRGGAVAVLAGKGCRAGVSARDLGVPLLRLLDVREAMGLLGSTFYGDPSRELEVVGITGTKGKTTTSWLLDQVLRVAGRTTGLFGTVENRVAERRFEALNTTASSLDIHSWLRELVDAGGRNATLEISSHALEQQRTAGVELDCAVFTNLAPEHLDYHLTMDRYLAAKSKLFRDLRGSAFAVLPRAEKASHSIAESTKANILWYGTDEEDGVKSLTMSPAGTELTWKGHRLKTRLWGLHNVENTLAAITAAECLGVDIDAIAEAIREPTLPPGRMEEVTFPAPFRVVVDYAHTDGSLEAVLDALRPMTPGRLITIFGCGGDRDSAKRPRMGKIAEACSDRIFVTSDKPRGEAPQRILDDIVEGLANPNDAAVVDDRREAIALGIRMAREGDTVLIAGKGHETYQELRGERVHFDDREVALEFLRESRGER